VRFLLLFSMSFSVELEERFSAYMAALNRHDVEAALSMTSLDLQRRDLLEWEASMEARSEFEIVSIRRPADRRPVSRATGRHRARSDRRRTAPRLQPILCA
jgi:hypothetical protein